MKKIIGKPTKENVRRGLPSMNFFLRVFIFGTVVVATIQIMWKDRVKICERKKTS